MTIVRHRQRLIVVLILLLCTVCIATNNAILCAVISAVFSGWNSLVTGWWILKVDHEKARRRICFVFHLALACWFGAPTALLSTFLTSMVANLRGQPANAGDLQVTLISLLLAVLVTCVVGLLAAVAAIIFRVRVWVHPRFRLLLQSELERPTVQFNCATFVLATSIGLPILAIGCIFAVNPAGPWAIPLIFLGGPILAIFAYGWIASRIFAASPRAYWDAPRGHD